MEADYKALEAAYLKERPQPGQALLVSLEGLIAPRPSMEAHQSPRLTLVVERFINVWPRESCGNPLVDSPLRGTYWKLVRSSDTPVPVADKQREPHLILASDTPHMSGSGGCNRLTGSFALDGDTLRLRHGRDHDGLPDRHGAGATLPGVVGKAERYRTAAATSTCWMRPAG